VACLQFLPIDNFRLAYKANEALDHDGYRRRALNTYTGYFTHFPETLCRATIFARNQEVQYGYTVARMWSG